MGTVRRRVENDIRLVGRQRAVGLEGEMSLWQRQPALQRQRCQVEYLMVTHIELLFGLPTSATNSRDSAVPSVNINGRHHAEPPCTSTP